MAELIPAITAKGVALEQILANFSPRRAAIITALLNDPHRTYISLAPEVGLLDPNYMREVVGNILGKLLDTYGEQLADQFGDLLDINRQHTQAIGLLRTVVAQLQEIGVTRRDLAVAIDSNTSTLKSLLDGRTLNPSLFRRMVVQLNSALHRMPATELEALTAKGWSIRSAEEIAELVAEYEKGARDPLYRTYSRDS